MSNSTSFASFHEKIFGKSVEKPEVPLSMHKRLNKALYNEHLDQPLQSEGNNNGLGKGWFNLKPAEMTESLQRDLQIIQMRNYLDPKRFYKNADKFGTILHVGTVIEGPTEYSSSRLSKRQRRESIIEEVLADVSVKKYSKRVFSDIQQTKQNKKKFRKSSKRQLPKLRTLF